MRDKKKYVSGKDFLEQLKDHKLNLDQFLNLVKIWNSKINPEDRYLICRKEYLVEKDKIYAGAWEFLTEEEIDKRMEEYPKQCEEYWKWVREGE